MLAHVETQAAALPPPYVLDVSVVVAIARGDMEIAAVALSGDAAGRRTGLSWGGCLDGRRRMTIGPG